MHHCASQSSVWFMFLALSVSLILDPYFAFAEPKVCPLSALAIPNFVNGDPMHGMYELLKCKSKNEGVFQEPAKIKSVCMERLTHYYESLTGSKENTVDDKLNDKQYMDQVERDYRLPSYVTNAMDADFFNSLRSSEKQDWPSVNQDLEVSVNRLQKKLSLENPGAQVIRFSSRHDTGIPTRLTDEKVITGKGRILIFLPGIGREKIDRYIQLVVPDKNTPFVKTGQFSIVTVDRTSTPPKTYYLDKWRNYDRHGKFTSVTRLNETKIIGGRCQICHLSGPLAIHPEKMDTVRYGKQLNAMNDTIANYDFSSPSSKPSSTDAPAAGSTWKYIYSSSLYDSCIPITEFRNDLSKRAAMAAKVRSNLGKCIHCHNSESGTRTSLNAWAFKSQGTLGGSPIEDHIVNIRESLGPKAIFNGESQGMPPDVALTQDEARYLYRCLKTSYLGDSATGFRGQLSNWITLRDDSNPELASCFYPIAAQACEPNPGTLTQLKNSFWHLFNNRNTNQ